MTLNHMYCDKYQFKEAEGKYNGFALQHVFTHRHGGGWRHEMTNAKLLIEMEIHKTK